MSKVKLRNTNPLGHVDLALIRRGGFADGIAGSGCLIPGEVFEVTAEQAGAAPHWRPATEDDAEAIARSHIAHRVVDLVPSDDEDADPQEVLEVLDPGHGLLAQVGNYELVDEKATGDGLDRMSVKDLVAHAAAQTPPIDLDGATKKADILAAIRKG